MFDKIGRSTNILLLVRTFAGRLIHNPQHSATWFPFIRWTEPEFRSGSLLVGREIPLAVKLASPDGSVSAGPTVAQYCRRIQARQWSPPLQIR